MDYRGRFAPSPTGRLHFGSLVAALGSWLRARASGGAWIVRIEDLDPPREVPGAAADILDTLCAFGMRSDEAVMFQSTRTTAYDAAFEQLQRSGHVFPCWCSRGDLESRGGVHHSPCFAPPSSTRAPAWRLRVPDIQITFDDAVFGRQTQSLRDVGDFVIRRVEGWYAYQLAVVVDDAAQGISEVVRGTDLLDSTARQIYLQRLLHFPTPAYLHLPLVLGADGHKLSKHERAHPVDPDDPLPALRSALEFLAQPVPVGAASATQLLQNALRDFNATRIKTVVRTPSVR
jgi:glutamyl-Q tRNA(Asp) synthetase